MTSMVQMNVTGTSGINDVKIPSRIDRMKEATRKIHTTVENRQFIQDLLKGEASAETYLQYLTDLRCIYEAIENELNLNQDNSKVSAIIIPELYRSKKLDKDLDFFSDLSRCRPMASQEAINFRETIRNCPVHQLPAYAYIRLLGDLFGGRDIGSAVENKWGENSISFYDYSELMNNYHIESLPAFAFRTYRNTFNQLKIDVREENELIEEAIKAYELTDELLLSYERK